HSNSIAMEYISGRDMSRIIPKAEKAGIPFPMIYALRIASNVCEGLYYAHTKTDAYGNPLHVVHRDVTPENVLVGFNGTVKIVDFGIAKANTQVERILMKALEKDKEKRYQSAWEMQFDIDTYLASSEFTPSNIHLSNFLKQIFGDEIEREKELLIKDKVERETSARSQRPVEEEKG